MADDRTPTQAPTDDGAADEKPSNPGRSAARSAGGSAAGENPRHPETGGSRRGGGVVVVILLVVLLAACGYLGYLVWDGARQDRLRATARADATRYVEQLASYDHTNVDANLDAVVADATPEFAERYREVSDGLRDLLTSGEGTSTGTATHVAVERVDDATATVLVFLDQTITNVTVPEGRTDYSRMVVTLTRDGDRWLLDDAQLA